MNIVELMVMMFIMKVNKRYLVISGIVFEGGNNLEIKSKNIMSVNRIEIIRVIFLLVLVGSIKI